MQGRGEPRPGVEQIDWGQGGVWVRGKDGRVGLAVFWPRREEAMDALRDHLNGRSLGSIFPTRKWCWLLVRRAGRRAGIPLHPHLLRHSAARNLLLQGVDVRFVQAWLRHASIEMTQRYTKVEPHDLIARAREREWR